MPKLSPSNFPAVATKISQKQNRHLIGDREYGGGGYLNSKNDAQTVLDAYHSGDAVILGRNDAGFPVVRFEGVTGTNVNRGAGYPSQPTNVFIIKGTAKLSIVLTRSNWETRK